MASYRCSCFWTCRCDSCVFSSTKIHHWYVDLAQPMQSSLLNIWNYIVSIRYALWSIAIILWWWDEQVGNYWVTNVFSTCFWEAKFASVCEDIFFLTKIIKSESFDHILYDLHTKKSDVPPSPCNVAILQNSLVQSVFSTELFPWQLSKEHYFTAKNANRLICWCQHLCLFVQIHQI